MSSERTTMYKFNLIKWCDDKISYLKKNNIVFKNGIPQLPSEFIYGTVPLYVSTFIYRNDIQPEHKKDSLLGFYMFENNLWPRLTKMDSDILIAKEYGGIIGFDLSPCIGMLRPRQRLSILVNAIFSCCYGLAGVKVLPNYRPGDISTVCAADYFPDNCSFMIGNLGCNRNGFKDYGLYLLKMALRKKNTNLVFVYGSISKADAYDLNKHYGISVISFPDRRNRVRNNSKSYYYHATSKGFVKTVYPCRIGGDLYGS